MDKKEALRKKRIYDKQYEFKKKQMKKQEVLRQQNNINEDVINLTKTKNDLKTPSFVPKNTTNVNSIINIDDKLNTIKKTQSKQNNTKPRSEPKSKSQVNSSKQISPKKQIPMKQPTKQKYKKNYTIYYVLLGIIFTMAIVFLSRNVLFKVDNIKILEIDATGKVVREIKNASVNSILSSKDNANSSKENNTSSSKDNASSGKESNTSSSTTNNISSSVLEDKNSSNLDDSSSSKTEENLSSSSKVVNKKEEEKPKEIVTTYDAEKIKLDSGVLLGDSLFKINTTKKSEDILANNIWLDKVEVKISLPQTLEIRILPAKPAILIKQNGKFYTFSKTNRIVDISTSNNFKDAILFKGIKLKDEKLGDFVDLTTNEQFIQYNNIINIAKDIKFLPITQIDITDLFDITIYCDNRFKITLGNYTDIDYKLNIAKKVITEEIEEHEKGTIDTSIKGKCNFIPGT